MGGSGGGWGDLAGSDLGTGPGWKKIRQNQTPLRSDETKSPGACTQLSPRRSTLPLLRVSSPPALRLRSRVKGPAAPMDKAAASGARGCRFESWAGQSFCEAFDFSLERGVENEPPVGLEPTTFQRLTRGKAVHPLVGRRSSLSRFGRVPLGRIPVCWSPAALTATLRPSG